MTQELALGTLLAAMVGLVWAMMVSVLWTDQDQHRNSDTEPNGDQDGNSRDTGNEPRRTMAA